MGNTEFFQIAIDGFSSCGKSTIAKELARRLGVIYVDSGAMYRAFAYHLLSIEGEISEDLAKRHLDDFEFELKNPPGQVENVIYLRGQDITHLIRGVETGQNASRVAQYKCVRKKLVDTQRELSRHSSVIMEGRDIGSVVFPKAELKIFLTASFEKRIDRRYLELREKGTDISRDEVCENLGERDKRDQNRAESPLLRSEDAVFIDNTNLTLVETVVMLEALAKERLRKYLL